MVRKEFVRDFNFLTELYGWTPEDVEEYRTLIRGSPQTMDYLATLAMAHRLGYQQTPDNNFVRLNVWLSQQGHAPITTYSEGHQ